MLVIVLLYLVLNSTCPHTYVQTHTFLHKYGNITTRYEVAVRVFIVVVAVG